MTAANEAHEAPTVGLVQIKCGKCGTPYTYRVAFSLVGRPPEWLAFRDCKCPKATVPIIGDAIPISAASLRLEQRSHADAIPCAEQEPIDERRRACKACGSTTTHQDDCEYVGPVEQYHGGKAANDVR